MAVHKTAVFLTVVALLCALGSEFSPAHAGGINTTLKKDEYGDWTVLYSASKPIERIAFSRNPDDSRVTRWKAVDTDLEIVVENNKEYIVSKIGALFQTVTLNLTPSYKHLSKDYAPFSPFSDGGTLMHSGRFFACEGVCDDEMNEWSMRLIVPIQDHIIIDGELVRSSVSWIDGSDGKNIYVGAQQPNLFSGFISVIDQGLPEEIKASLQTDIPKMMAHLEAHLGKLASTQKPSLFASYAKVDGTSTQGGALPNQIFIHWNRNNLEEQVKNQKFVNDLLWTFAHEAGHFYQQFGNMVPQREDSWIHEGHAEMLAFNTLNHLYPESQDYLSAKTEGFKRHCGKGLNKLSLADAAQNNEFSLYYSCGFLIHQAIENSFNKTSNQEHSAYQVWNRFRDNSDTAEKKGKVMFLKTVTELGNKELANAIDNFVSNKHLDPQSVIESLERLP